MNETFTVPARFCGPPESGNGGWTCGHLAQFVGTTDAAPAVAVRLHTPPPLDRPMAVREREQGAVEVVDGDVLVASAWPAPALERSGLPPPARYLEALSVGGTYAGLHDHPFPTCFVCGVEREPGDALCLRTGALPGREGVYAAAWASAESTPEIVWAALDCPGAWALGAESRPMVLGTMTAQLHDLPAEGEEHVVMAWARAGAERKHECGTALYDTRGVLLAQANATWIEIDPGSIRPAAATRRIL